jgi:hypothetical protein
MSDRGFGSGETNSPRAFLVGGPQTVCPSLEEATHPRCYGEGYSQHRLISSRSPDRRLTRQSARQAPQSAPGYVAPLRRKRGVDVERSRISHRHLLARNSSVYSRAYPIWVGSSGIGDTDRKSITHALVFIVFSGCATLESRLLQIARVEVFGKPAVDRSEQFAIAVFCPGRARAAHAHCGADSQDLACC